MEAGTAAAGKSLCRCQVVALRKVDTEANQVDGGGVETSAEAFWRPKQVPYRESRPYPTRTVSERPLLGVGRRVDGEGGAAPFQDNAGQNYRFSYEV